MAGAITCSWRRTVRMSSALSEATSLAVVMLPEESSQRLEVLIIQIFYFLS